MSGPYIVQGPMRAQDGATVWAVMRPGGGAGRLLAIAEYMSEHAAIRGAAELNHAAQQPQTATDAA